MASSHYSIRSGSKARGVLVGSALGLVGVCLLSEFTGRLSGDVGWAVAIIFTTTIPAIAVGIVVGISIETNRIQRGEPHPIGSIAGLLIAICAAVILIDVNIRAQPALHRHLGGMPLVDASALLVLRVGTLVGIWQIGRWTSRSVSKAIDDGDGRSRLPDIAFVALSLGFLAMLITGGALHDLLTLPVAPEHPNLRGDVIQLGVALLIGALSIALFRQSRYATYLAACIAVLATGWAFATWLLAPPGGADPREEFRVAVLVAAVMSGFVVYFHWRLPRRTRATSA